MIKKKKKINGNDLAVAACRIEGKVSEVNIANMKESQRATFRAMIENYTESAIRKFFSDFRAKRKKEAKAAIAMLWDSLEVIKRIGKKEA